MQRRSFQALNNTIVYVLGSDGKVWREKGDASNRSNVDGNVAQFQAMDDTLVYVLGTDGNLWREQGDASHRGKVDGNVAQFQALDNTVVYVLGRDGNLWREQGDASNRGKIDGNVAQFQALDNTLVYVLGRDGNLWREQGDASSRTKVDGNVGIGHGNGAGGPIVADWPSIVFGGGVPVGGWANLTITSDGSYNFAGGFHDSGFTDYDVAVIFAVRSSKGSVFTFANQGKVNGTFSGGSRDFPWNIPGNNGVLKNTWNDLEAGWSWRADAAANLSLTDLWNDIKTTVGEIAQVVSVVGEVVG